MEYARFLDLLACPECLKPVRLSPGADAELKCTECGSRYPVHDGIPVLLPPGEDARALLEALSSQAGRRMQQEYAQHEPEAPHRKRPLDPVRRWLERMREPIYNTPWAPIGRMFESQGDATRIVSVGGGPTRNNPKEINLNIGPFANVDVVGDAHRLPFLTGSVDGAWANAVLEHVADAPRVALEMQRIVRPGGYVAVLQPFMQAYHSYPSDFWRFTRDGVARLFPECEPVAQGTYVGPTFALLKLGEMYLTHYLPVLLHTRRRLPLRIALTLYTLLFYPFKRLDKRLAPHESGHLQASVVYWVGRKRE